ncbi:MAG: hypothetical protein K2I62_06350 [Alistipes sp.]|nr:hypothetical protein [Alistipes sp.]
MPNTTIDRFNQLIERVVGLPLETIQEQPAEQTDRFVETKNAVPLHLDASSRYIQFRGNPLLSYGRTIGENINEMFDRKFGIIE